MNVPSFLPPAWPNREASRRVHSSGVDWHLQVSGPALPPPDATAAGQPPVILLLHGTGGSTHEWAEVLPALAPSACVVAPDLPGHGFTGRGHAPDEVMTLPGMARAVGALLQRLELAPTIIAGHSAGAAVALRMTLDQRAAPRAVVGFNPALIPPPELWVTLLAPLAGVVVESSLAAQAAAWAARRAGVTRTMLESSGASLTAEQVRRYETLFAEPAHCAAALAMMSRWDLPQLARDAHALPVPFDAWAGERDRWVPLKALRAQVAQIPTATLHSVPGAGHLLPEERPDLVVSAILEMMRS